jgi:hypothetical protein
MNQDLLSLPPGHPPNRRISFANGREYNTAELPSLFSRKNFAE